MPVNIRKLKNAPIIVATLTGYITPEDTLMVYSETDRILNEGEEYLYRITDVYKADSNFGDMLKILMYARDHAGSSTDPRVKKVAFVGKNTWGDMFRNAVGTDSFGNLNIPFFMNVEDAIQYFVQLDDTIDSSLFETKSAS